jgi:hypothetical protein
MIRSISVVLVASALVACASRDAKPVSTVTTSAEVPSAEATPPAPAPEQPMPETKAAEPASTGPAATCHLKGEFGETIELFLDWKGDEATGQIKTTAESGEVHVQRLRAQRADGLIVADDVAEPEDLVAHAALVKDHHGKRYIRLGSWNAPWKQCE